MASKMKTAPTTCVLCCHESSVWAVSKCDHPICLRCCAKLRLLCDQRDCPVCRLTLDLVVIVAEVKPFSQLSPHCMQGDHKYQIFFENNHHYQIYKTLKEKRCVKCSVNTTFRSFKQLRDHVNKFHDLHYCAICVDNLKLFPTEFKLYTRLELANHRREGDPDDSSYKGHPLCKFCDDRYFDNDELHAHLRTTHFWCHICETDGKQDYYMDYYLMRKHFKDGHYLCEEGDCKEDKYTSVFRSKIDLQAHRASTHSRGLSKAEVKQMKQLELGFSYAGGGREAVIRTATRPRYDRGPTTRVYSKSGMIAQLKEKTLELATVQSAYELTQLDETRCLAKKRSPLLKKRLASLEEPRAPPGFSAPQSSATSSLTVTGVESNPYNMQAGRDPAPGLTSVEVTRPPGFEAVNDVQQKASIVAEWPGLLGDKPTVTPSPQELLSSNSEHTGSVQSTHGVSVRPWTQNKVAGGYEQNFPSLAIATAVQNENNEEFVKLKNEIDICTSESSPPLPGSTVESKVPTDMGKTATCSNRSDSSTSRKVKEGKVVERVWTVLGKDKSKFTEFKTLSGWYRNGEITVQEYYDQCSSLFGSSWKDIGPQVASVLPDKSKKTELEDVLGLYTPFAAPTKKPKYKKSKAPPATVWMSGPPVTTTHPPATKQPPPPASRAVLSESDYPSLGTANSSKVTSVQGNWSMVVRS